MAVSPGLLAFLVFELKGIILTPPPWRRWLRPPPGRGLKGLSLSPQRFLFLTSVYPGFSASGWFRRALLGHDRWMNTSGRCAPCCETKSRHCMPTLHTQQLAAAAAETSQTNRQQDAKALGQLTPRRRDRTRASVGGWARAAAGLSRRCHSRCRTLCRSLKRSRWREASRRWRAGSRSPAKTPRTAPARHLHRRRLLFASQQTIIHAQRSAGRQAVSGQRDGSACMFDGWIPIVDARYRYILGPTEVNVASRPVLCVYVCVLLDSRFACEINNWPVLHCSYIQRWSTLGHATEYYVAFYFLAKSTLWNYDTWWYDTNIYDTYISRYAEWDRIFTYQVWQISQCYLITGRLARSRLDGKFIVITGQIPSPSSPQSAALDLSQLAEQTRRRIYIWARRQWYRYRYRHLFVVHRHQWLLWPLVS